MIQRYAYLEQLKQWKDKKLIKVITWIRRCGKSTLFQLYIDYLKEIWVKENHIISINLESLDYDFRDYRELYNYINSKLIDNDKYYVFYSVSTFGSNTSCIGLASTTDLMSNVWEDLGVVMASSTSDTYNCIDPSFIEDSGKTYMAFGSWWKGLYIIELDSTTLKVKDNSKPVLLASREASSNAIEGVTIFKQNNYYYLLASYDLCCRGTQSTYSTRYGRSENLFGPYIDEKGKEMIKGGGTILLSSKGTRIGPGGEDVFKTENGSWALCAHYYDALQNGRATLLIKDLNFTEDFWLY